MVGSRERAVGSRNMLGVCEYYCLLPTAYSLFPIRVIA